MTTTRQTAGRFYSTEIGDVYYLTRSGVTYLMAATDGEGNVRRLHRMPVHARRCEPPAELIGPAREIDAA